MIERLETAYEARFDRQACLVFLNDAYQELLALKSSPHYATSPALQTFAEQFLRARDLFILQAVDRYPSNFAEVASKIQVLKDAIPITVEKSNTNQVS